MADEVAMFAGSLSKALDTPQHRLMPGRIKVALTQMAVPNCLFIPSSLDATFTASIQTADLLQRPATGTKRMIRQFEWTAPERHHAVANELGDPAA